jgi:hypothetical protein
MPCFLRVPPFLKRSRPCIAHSFPDWVGHRLEQISRVFFDRMDVLLNCWFYVIKYRQPQALINSSQLAERVAY